jgi:hypothetical protein
MRLRLALGALGLGLMGFGGLRFLQTGWDNVANAVVWLAGGVALHDGIIAPVTIVLTVLLRRVVPVRHRARTTLALVVVATVTATAIPVLGRWGARSDNPTLLPRDYTSGWLVLVGAVLAVVVVEASVTRLRSRARP